jgi:MSHA pilin protein MshD
VKSSAKKQHIRGFTLMELVLVIVILGLGAVSFLILVNQTARHSIDPMLRQQAHAVAQSYLEEVLLNAFCDPDLSTDCPAFCTGANNACTACTAAEANRSLFDDVCDYDGIADAGARDRADNPVAGLEDFNVSVSVDDGSDGSPVILNGLSSGSSRVLRIDVNVTHGNVPDIDLTLSGYRANY